MTLFLPQFILWKIQKKTQNYIENKVDSLILLNYPKWIILSILIWDKHRHNCELIKTNNPNLRLPKSITLQLDGWDNFKKLGDFYKLST